MDMKDQGTLIELKIGTDSHYIQILPKETVNEFSARLEETLGVRMDIGDVDGDADTLTYFTTTTRDNESESSNTDVGTVIEEGLFCCVPGCSSNTMDNPELAIFKFPSQKKRCWDWLEAISRNDLRKESLKFLSTRLGVCRDHFSENQFMKNNTVLKYSATPFLPAIKVEHDPNLGKSFRCCFKQLNSTVFSTCLKLESPEDNQTLDQVTEDTTHPGALCRLCANSLETEPIFIFGPNNEPEPCADLISACLPIEVSQVDPLPKQICQICFERLKMQNSFTEACLAAEKKLIGLTRRFNVTDDVRGNNKATYCCPLCCLGGMSHADNNLLDETTTDGGHVLTEVDDGLYSDENDTEGTQLLIRASPMSKIYLSEDQNFAYECEICEESFDGPEPCLEHCLAHGSHEYFPCTPCGLVFPSEVRLKEHFAQHKIKIVNAKKMPWKTVLFCRTCNYQTGTRKNFILHKCSSPVLDQRNFEVAKDLTCVLCDRTFLSELRASKHRARHEGTLVETFECEECKTDFLTVKMFAHHKAVEHDGVAHRCDECELQFLSEHHLDKHKRLHAKNLATESTYQYQCSVCLKKFSTLNFINRHLTTHQQPAANEETEQGKDGGLKCSKCPQTFRQRSHLQHHLETSHDTIGRMPSLIQYQCNICSERITSSTEVLGHRTQHWKSQDPMLPHVCEYCGEAHPSPNALARHRRYLHPDEHPYICTLCETTTRTLYEARVHRKTHTGYSVTHTKQPVKIHQCEQCPSLFTDRESFLAHRKNHKTAKWYPCDQCDKVFPERHRLTIHQRQHTGEKPYTCGTCGKSFAQTSAMYTHALLHTGETPHACDLCNRKFRIKSDRDSHRRTHTGEKPYKCPFCYKTFRTGQVYYQHRMIHTGERRFRCDVCNQAFKRSHTLVVHKRIHTGEKPNICDVCGKGFRQRTDMRKHRAHLHGVSN